MNRLQFEFQSLVAQNQSLRIKCKKIDQIQSFVNILISSNQKYQFQLQQKNRQIFQLQTKSNNLISQTIRLQQKYQHELHSLQKNYQKQLSIKEQQLRKLSLLFQKQQHSFDQIMNENKIKSKSDIQRIRIQLNHVQEEYGIELRKIKNILNEKNKQSEIKEENHKIMKKQFIEEVKKLNYQISQLAKVYQQTKQDNVMQNEEINKLKDLINKAKDQQNRLKKQLIQLQQGYLDEKRNMEKIKNKLEKQLHQLAINEQKLIEKQNSLSNELQKVKRQNISLTQQSYSSNLRQTKLNNLLQQKQRQLTQLSIKKQQQQQQFKRLSKRSHQQLLLNEQQLHLANERFQSQKRLNDIKTIQITDLIHVIDKLQSSNVQNQQKIFLLTNQNAVLFKQVENITKILQSRDDDLNLYDVKMKQLNQNCIIIEQMYKRQQLKAKKYEEDNQQLLRRVQLITKKQNDINQQQRNMIIQNHLKQKRDILENHRQQNERLIRKNELALKDKDQQAKKRLELLENQINLMRVRH